MNRGHVHQEAAWQRDVAGDARALLAERLLGDLDDHILAGPQHFGNELRTARRAGMASLITAVMPRATGPTAFETRSAAGASAAIGTATAAIRAPATAIKATVASTAAERPLESRTRVAADARGVAREIFTRSRWAANARSTSFAREENYVVFDGRRAFRNGFAGGRRDYFLFGMLRLDAFVLGMFLPAVLVRAMRGVAFGVFLGHVRGKFRAAGRASGFDFLGFFLGELRNLRDGCFFRFFRWFFRFFFVEFGAADDGIGFRFFLRLFVLGLDESGGECGHLIFVQISIIPCAFHIVTSR